MLMRSPHWRCGDGGGGGAYAYVALLVVLLLAGDATVTRVVVQAAHSQKRVAVRTRVVHVYDRSITTFDPQGRLLQVEYGLEAANRGSPIVALITNETAYVGMLSSSSSSSGGRTKSGGLSPTTTTTTTTAIRPLHRLDDHLFLVTSGLAGDALALAAELRLGAVRHAWANGEPMTVRECATAAANVQHTLTKQAGARPLGITALVLGIDGSSSSSSNDNDTGPRLYRCHAGGSLQDVWYAAAGKNERAAMKKLQQAYATRQAAAQEDPSTNEQFIVQTIVSALKAATEAKRDKQSFDVWIMRPQKGTHPTATTTTTSIACIQGLTNSVSKKDLQKTLESLQAALQQ